MKHRVKSDVNRKYYIWIILQILLLISLYYFKEDARLVEQLYSRGFYPIWSYVYVFLCSWIPFSVGDLVYVGIFLTFIYLFFNGINKLISRNILVAKRRFLQLLLLGLTLYNLFYINWGLHYFRIPLSEQLGLQTEQITEAEHEEVLFRYIKYANELRDNIDFNQKHKWGVRGDITEYLQQDTVFDRVLSKTQIHAKVPLSSNLMSYFAVSGYFNPFTMEAHINEAMPLVTYPFVTVHELAHQMGIGFEDECNFIAFIKLYQHKDIWYRYAAYYSAIESLIMPYRNDKGRMEDIRRRLSPKVLADFQEEREFWLQYRGPIDAVSAWFYNYFLQHNNQPEGLVRYSMMSKLIVAWEKQKLASH